MIGWLSGRVVRHLRNGAVIVDVGGVGYEVHVAAAVPPGVDSLVELSIYTVVRDDAIQLYGFSTVEDREFFELLLATPGVGPATALGALRTMGVDEMSLAIDADDVKKVATIPGIGQKTASRIVLELKGKVSVDGDTAVAPASHVNAAVDDALRALGYGPLEIRQALGDVVLPEEESAALRAALALLRRP